VVREARNLFPDQVLVLACLVASSNRQMQLILPVIKPYTNPRSLFSALCCFLPRYSADRAEFRHLDLFERCCLRARKFFGRLSVSLDVASTTQLGSDL
jgi:hypothetical protein